MYAGHSCRCGECQWFIWEKRWSIICLCDWGGWSQNFTHAMIVQYLILWTDDPYESRKDYLNPNCAADTPCSACSCWCWCCCWWSLLFSKAILLDNWIAACWWISGRRVGWCWISDKHTFLCSYDWSAFEWLCVANQMELFWVNMDDRFLNLYMGWGGSSVLQQKNYTPRSIQ